MLEIRPFLSISSIAKWLPELLDRTLLFAKKVGKDGILRFSENRCVPNAGDWVALVGVVGTQHDPIPQTCDCEPGRAGGLNDSVGKVRPLII